MKEFWILLALGIVIIAASIILPTCIDSDPLCVEQSQ